MLSKILLYKNFNISIEPSSDEQFHFIIKRDNREYFFYQEINITVSEEDTNSSGYPTKIFVINQHHYTVGLLDNGNYQNFDFIELNSILRLVKKSINKLLSYEKYLIKGKKEADKEDKKILKVKKRWGLI